MIMKKYFILILLVAIGLLFSVSPVALAKADKGELKLKVFVHYPKPDDDNPGKKPVSKCQTTIDDLVTNYGLTGWKLPSGDIIYQINYSTKPRNVSTSEVTLSVEQAFNVWETEVITFNEGLPVSISGYKKDGVNLVAWGAVPNNAIGVTYTWYYSGTGEWAESDTILNKRLVWDWTVYSGDCNGTAGAYDIQNIMTHENGHWLGLDDLYDSASKDLTMYGYGITSELKKDTLGVGDIMGRDLLY